MTSENKYKKSLSAYLECDSDQLFLYWKGRVALYSALKAMGIGPGDEVILPAFTCVVVPNAILYLGAQPIYVDINEDSLNTSLDKIKQATTEKTKCILIQNTFGLSSEVEEITEYAKTRSIYTIEDCTHGFGGYYHGKPNGSRSDCSFYSSQWNKPFSTGIGGILLVNNKKLLGKVAEVNQELIVPSFKSRLMLKTLLLFNRFFINDFTYWILIKFYRFLSKIGLVIGSSSNFELTSIKMPPNYFMASSNVQAVEGEKALVRLKALMELRAKNSKRYTSFLIEKGKTHVNDQFHADHAFLKYPLIVKNRNEFMLKAEKKSIRLGEWFISPIHPVEENFEIWKLEPADFPHAEKISSQIVNLPTETKNATKIIQFLQENLDNIL